MGDPFDIDLQDPDLHEEIQLVAELMVAATSSSRPLSQSEVDAVLCSALPRQRG